MFYIVGGEYRDFEFRWTKDFKSVFIGPFDVYQDAYDEWKRLSWLNVDNALYRLTIEEYRPSRLSDGFWEDGIVPVRRYGK